MREPIFATDENVNEPGFGRRFFVTFAEKPDLITNASAADVYNSQPGCDRLRKRNFSLKNTARFGTQRHEGSAVDVQPANANQECRDNRVHVAVVFDIVYVTEEIIVFPPCGNGKKVAVSIPHDPS